MTLRTGASPMGSMRKPPADIANSTPAPSATTCRWPLLRSGKRRTHSVIPATIEIHNTTPGHVGGAKIISTMSVALGSDLRARGLDVTLTTLNPQGAYEAERANLHVLHGDSLHQQILLEAGVTRARLIVIAEDNPETAAGAVTSVRGLTDAPIFVRPLGGIDVEALAAAGASHVVDADVSTRNTMLISILERLEMPPLATRNSGGIDVTRLNDVTWPPETACEHSDSNHPVLPVTSGCAECERDGQSWLHLRVCLACGHVGCCDSSPNQHARTHHATSDHPLITSGEDEEFWAYCFVGDITVQP